MSHSHLLDVLVYVCPSELLYFVEVLMNQINVEDWTSE